MDDSRPTFTNHDAGQSSLSFGEFELDRRRRELLHMGEAVTLTPKQFDVLEYLVCNPDRVLTKGELLQAVWPDSHVQESNLSQNVFWLRKVLGQGAEDEVGNRFIVTVPGRGYRFVAPVRSAAGDAAAEQAPAAAPLPVSKAVPVKAARRWHWAWAAATLVVVLLTSGYAWRAHRKKAAYQPQVSPEVIVIPFQNTTADPSLTVALNSILRRGIAQSPVVYVVPRALINKTLGYMQLPLDTAITPTTARQICIRRNSTATVQASVSPEGSGYGLTLEAVQCVTGKTISMGHAVAAREEDLLVTLDSLIPRLRQDLGESATSLRQFTVPVENATTASLEAYKAFLEAEALRLKGENGKAVPLYLRAISLDDNFALAHLGLGTAYQSIEERGPSMKEFQRAYDLAGRISPRERLYVEYFYIRQLQGDIPASLPLSEEWERRYPTDPSSWVNQTDALNQLDRYEDAIRHGERALVLFPSDGDNYVTLAQAYLRAGRYADVGGLRKRVVALGLDGWQFHQMAWQAERLTGDTVKAQEDRAWANGRPDEYLAHGSDAMVALQDGRIHDALAAQARMARLAKAQNAMSAVDENRGWASFALAEMGLPALAHAQVDGWKAAYPIAEIGLAVANLGETAKAETIAKNLADGRPRDTLVNQWRVPVLRAALALHGDTETGARSALTILEAARALDLHDNSACYLRGKAHMRLRNYREAEKEFTHIANSPGADPFSPLLTLTYLRLARTRAASGDTAGSRAAYENAIARWANADPSLPVLLQAKQELALLP